MKISNSRLIKDHLFLLSGAILLYWPLSFQIFSLKNDAVSYFLPWRYQVSESIQNAFFPFWTPYLYTGMPLHADIQSGVWNPVVMLFSVLGRYDMGMLQWETLLYITIGIFGFFRLCLHFNFQKNASLLLAIAYGGSGFMIDSCSFIPWICSAAYIPFTVLYFLRTLQKPAGNNTIKLAFSAALLLLAGYPSFFIQLLYTLVLIAAVYLVHQFRNGQRKDAILLLKHLAVAATATLLLCSPALLSYLSFFGYYQRGSGADLQSALFNPFHIRNGISFLFPASGYFSNGNNDISSRNIYFGIIPLLFLFYSFRAGFTRTKAWIIALTIFFFLFSLGEATPIRNLAYRFLPGMDSFRHPGNSRLFTIIGLLLLSGSGITAFFKTPDRAALKIFIGGLILLVASFMAYALFFLPEKATWPQTISISALKDFKDHAPLASWIILTGSIQLLCLVAALFIPARSTRPWLVLSCINIFLQATIAMPFTLFSQVPTREMNTYLNSFPSGFPKDQAIRTVSVDDLPKETISPYGYIPFYEKRISIQAYIISPTLNSTYHQLLGQKEKLDSLRNKRPFYLEEGNLQLRLFTPNVFTINTAAGSATQLNVIQQYHHFWKASIDGHQVPITRNGAFMQVAVPAGSHEIRLVYRPVTIIIASIISLLSAALMLGLLFLDHRRKRRSR